MAGSAQTSTQTSFTGAGRLGDNAGSKKKIVVRCKVKPRIKKK